VKDALKADELAGQLLLLTPPLIAIAEETRTMLLTNHSTMAGLFGELDDAANLADIRTIKSSHLLLLFVFLLLVSLL